MKSVPAAALGIALLLGGCASPQTLRPFTTDGCSLFPDGNYCECCVNHDKRYWRGGTAEERQQADADMRECIRVRRDGGVLAGAMYHGVRLGGLPIWPTPFRWAYGWGYGRGYTPLSEDEQQRARELVAQAPEAPLLCGPER